MAKDPKLQKVARQDSLDTNKVTSKQVMKRMLHAYILPHKKILALSFVALLMVALTTSAIPLLIQRITDDLFVNKNADALSYLPLAIVIIMGLKALSCLLYTSDAADD